MPTLPDANRSKASWRLVLPGLFWVSFLSAQALEEGQRLDVLRAVDGPLAVLLPVTAVVEQPDRELALGLLGAEREPVADVALAEGLDLLGVRLELGPGLRGRGDAGLLEEGLVVEHRPGRAEVGHAVHLAVVGARLHEGVEQVGLDRVGEHVVRAVEQVVLGVARVGVEVEDVRRVVVLDHRRALLVDVVPADDLHLEGVARLGLVGRGELVPERLRVVLRVLGRDELDRGRLGARSAVVGRPGSGAASAGRQPEGDDRAARDQARGRQVSSGAHVLPHVLRWTTSRCTDRFVPVVARFAQVWRGSTHRLAPPSRAVKTWSAAFPSIWLRNPVKAAGNAACS